MPVLWITMQLKFIIKFVAHKFINKTEWYDKNNCTADVFDVFMALAGIGIRKQHENRYRNSSHIPGNCF